MLPYRPAWINGAAPRAARGLLTRLAYIAWRMRATLAPIAGLCLLVLGGCDSPSRMSGFGYQLLHPQRDDPAAAMAAAEPAARPAEASDPVTTGSLSSGTGGPGAAEPAGPRGRDDELARGKTEFGAGHYAAAERHFRRAAERHPENVEAWLGLAATCDQQRRFGEADRAYDRAVDLLGPTPEILNNRGYSYMLRGDYERARQTLLDARAKDPESPYIKNNLDLLESKARKAKATAR